MNYKIYNKIYELRDDCPEEVILELKERKNEIDSEIYFKYLEFWPKMKKFVIGKCYECGNLCKNRTDKIRYRKYSNDKLLCSKCISVECSKHEEFIRNNSNAQIIAQNKPETKLKMSISLKKAWQNEEVAKKWILGIASYAKSEESREKISKASKKLWQTEEYRSKMLDRFVGFRGVSGIFKSKFSGEIRFDSTYEFFYLFYQDINKIEIKRFNREIKYLLNDEIKGYRPDFIDNNNNLIEIKSSYIKKINGLDELNSKRYSALKFIKENNYNDYFLLEERDLKLMGDLDLRYKIMHLLILDEHISIYRGVVRPFKTITENVLKAKELYKQWNLLK